MTERQKQILLAIISEFMNSGQPVGSSVLADRYNLEVSPATIRNDMVDLSEEGYLRKSHSSSGRVPTDLGLRIYIRELMREEALSNLKRVQEVSRLFNQRFEEKNLMKEVMLFLSEETSVASFTFIDDIMRYHGVSRLMDYDELKDIEIVDSVLTLLEDEGLIKKLFSDRMSDDVCIAIGSECNYNHLDHCSILFTQFDYVGNKHGYVGVIGPRRLDYSRTIPVIRFVRDAIERSVRGW